MSIASFGISAIGHGLMDATGVASNGYWGRLKPESGPSHVSSDEASALLDELRTEGALAGPGLVFNPGGGALNIAVAARTLGMQAVAAACLGTDSLGAEIRARLETLGVFLVGPSSKKATGLFISISPPPECGSKTEPMVVVSPSAAREIRGYDGQETMFRPGWYFHVDGLLMDRSDWLSSLAREAKAKGMGVSLDASTVHAARSRGRELVRFAAEFCDYFFVNEREYDSLVKVLSAGEGLGSCSLVRKLGPRGAMLTKDGETFLSETEPMDVPFEVGAGDAFAAGFLKASMEDRSPKEMLAMGNVSAGARLKALNFPAFGTPL